MGIKMHLSKNLHHAYLLEGERDKLALEVLAFLKTIDFKTSGNPDFAHIVLDTLRAEDARSLKSMMTEKSLTGEKRIFLISVNSFLLDAQNTLLKMFEEPVPHTHIFLIVPDASSLLKTFFSRFYFISALEEAGEELETKKFLNMPKTERLEFIKEFLVEEDWEDENGEEITPTDSVRAKASRFLNSLESRLYDSLVKDKNMVDIFEHFFKVRQFLRQPGSSVKNLMESVAFILPVLPQKKV